MPNSTIRSLTAVDARFALPPGAGSDAVHTDPIYCMAVTRLAGDGQLAGTGIALTLGEGNRLVCETIELLARALTDVGVFNGMGIEEVMSGFGAISRSLADHPSLRWLGPHKGVMHLALSSITNAFYDFWAKSRGVPLWKLLLGLSAEEVVATLDLSYVEDVLSEREALGLLRANGATRMERESILKTGYPGYDTSVGWMGYDDQKVRELTARAIDQGFRAFKLKVGSALESRDLSRAAMLRDAIGGSADLMFDANQHWNLPDATRMCHALSMFKPLWIEEPTHPDDVHGHAALTRKIVPTRLAAGEHVSNRVLFKNFFQYQAIHFVQADCTRLAGVSEFLTVSLMAKKFGLPIVPHVGDMGQVHQHLVLFNRIALDHETYFLEHIPHLKEHFVYPARVVGGFYETPQEPGASTDMFLPGKGVL